MRGDLALIYCWMVSGWVPTSPWMVTSYSMLCLRYQDYAQLHTFYIALPGYPAFRNTKTGSWFIQELVQTFAERACKEHFLDLLVEVCFESLFAFI